MRLELFKTEREGQNPMRMEQAEHILRTELTPHVQHEATEPNQNLSC